MKKIFLFIFAAIGILACEKTPDFPDYKFTSVYFPLQTPLRTLILGEYTSDNSLDNKYQFNMGVALGGLRENKNEEWVKFEIRESLVENFVFSDGSVLEALPQKYYTTSPASGEKIIIPKGSMEGKVLVTLTPEFFSDPDANKKKYVIPVIITEKSSGIDTVLQGKPLGQNPNLLIASDWSVAPKNYTLFGIKFVNELHGNYLHFGADYFLDAEGKRIASKEPVKYSQFFIEKNEIWPMVTAGRYDLLSPAVANSNASIMKLTLNTDSTIDITPVSGTKVIDPTLSTGRLAKKAVKWGGKSYDALFLDYKYTEYYELKRVPVDDKDASITYTGTWMTAAEAQNYGGDRHYSTTIGDYFTFSFTGVEVALYFKIGNYGTFDVYLDDMFVPAATNVNSYNPSTVWQRKLFERTGLTPGKHNVKVVVKEAKNIVFDYFDYMPVGGLPNGTYLHEVKDTLVFRDKGITFETFAVKPK
jgi:hypothetical protein